MTNSAGFAPDYDADFNFVATLSRYLLLSVISVALLAAIVWLVFDVVSADSGAGQLPRSVTLFASVVVITALIIALTQVWRSSRILHQSISALETGGKKIAAGDLEHRIAAAGGTSLDGVADRLNTLAQQLSEQRESMLSYQRELETRSDDTSQQLQRSSSDTQQPEHSRRQMLADISHELRTPLTVIRGEAEVALRGGGRTTDEYRESLQRILEQAEQTTRLVDDLLSLARSDLERIDASMQKISLQEMLGSVCTEFCQGVNKTDSYVDRHFAEDPLIVHGDQQRLRQVFSMLIDFAAHRATGDGQIDVTATKYVDEAEVTVRGTGLPQQEEEQSGKQNQHSNAVDVGSRPSTLDLPLAKAIVEAHRGRIILNDLIRSDIESKVYLPLATERTGSK